MMSIKSVRCAGDHEAAEHIKMKVESAMKSTRQIIENVRKCQNQLVDYRILLLILVRLWQQIQISEK